MSEESDDSTSPAQGQQESSEVLLRQILNVLLVKQSTTDKTLPPSDDWNGFWDAYDQEAEEFDKSFVEKYASDLDNILIFAGLFSVVNSTFLGAMLPSLNPVLSDTTKPSFIMIYHQLNHTAFPGQVLSLPSWDGPLWITVWTQTLLYASLSASLLAALGAVLGKQWLRDYRDNTRGPRESRRMRRQVKADGLVTWHFEAVLRAIPALLKLSLLLFGTGLGGYLWYQQRTVASAVVGTTCLGASFYILASLSSYLYVSCPFTAPALALVYYSLSAIRSSAVIYVMRPLNWVVYTTIIRLNKWRSVWRPIVLPLAILIYLVYAIPLILLGILWGAVYFLPPPDDQPVVDVSRSVLWLCQTSLDPDVVFTAAKMIPDVTFPTDGPASWAAWGKLFRLVQDGLKRPSPSSAVLVYAKALTSLYFTSYTSKNRFSPFLSRVHIQDVATLLVDVHRSHDATSLCFVLSVFQQWFDVVSGVWIIRIPEGKDIISALGPGINLDDVPDDTLEWFLYPLLHGLCGASLPWYKEEYHSRHLFLQPLAIYIIRRLLPIDQPRPLPPRKTIVRCLHVMIAILDWQSIDLEEIKITDNSDKIETIFPRVLTLLLRSDITAAIRNDRIPDIQHPKVTRSIFSRSPSSRTFSINEVSHFRAILEPLARLASETEFKHHFRDSGVETWSTSVFQATVPKNIEDASTSALCLHACCTMDGLFKSGVIHSATIWDPCHANADASVLLDYLNRAHLRFPQPNLNLAVSHLPPRRWLHPEFQNNIATAHALLMLSADNAIFTPGTTTTVVHHIIFAMKHAECPLHRHVGLKVAHVIKEPLVNITGYDRDQLLPALRSATFENIQSDTITPGDTSPDRFIYPERDLHYLEVLFTLTNSEHWLSQLRQDNCAHMQRCISIAQAIHTPSHEEDYRELSLQLVLIFARIACTDTYVWPKWDDWFIAHPDNQALLVKQAWECPRILGVSSDVTPLLIAFTNKMLSSLRSVSKKDLVILSKDTVIATLDGISKQVDVDARVHVDEMQNVLEVLRTDVVHSRGELLRHFGAQ